MTQESISPQDLNIINYYSQNKRYFSPKNLIDAMQGYDVNLKKIAIRRDKGLLKAGIPTNQKGQKNLYDFKTSLIFCLAIKYETTGMNIDDAFKASDLAINYHLWQNNLWLITLFGENTQKEQIIVYKSAKISNKLSENEEKTLNSLNIKPIFLNPFPDKYFYFQENEYNVYKNILRGKIEGIKSLFAGEMINDCLIRLNATEDEIEDLKIQSAKNYERQALN